MFKSNIDVMAGTESRGGPDAESPSIERRHFLLEIILIGLLCSAGAVAESFRLESVTPPIWGHLRAGIWILHNHRVPRTGLFSRSSDLQWVDLHWLYQTSLALIYEAIGLRAIPLLSMLIGILLAVVTFRLARQRNTPFPAALLIAGLALLLLYRPGQSTLSALFFALELWIVSRFRAGAATRLQWMLLPLFCVWANVDSGFVFGISYLALLALVTSLRMLRNEPARSAAVSVWALLAGACFATLVSPYGFAVWRAAWTELYSQSAIRYIAEMRPMAFRTPLDFIALLFAMGSMSVLGFRRKHDLLDLSALAIAMAVAFRFPREFWLLTLCCASAVSNSLQETKPQGEAPHVDARRAWRAGFGVAAVVIVFLAIAVARVPGDLRALSKKSGANLPIEACDAIREAHFPQPIFNLYMWGDFLTWYLPDYPVAVDSRMAMYGDVRTNTYFDLIQGKVRLEDTPVIATANILLLNTGSDLARALINIPQLAAQFQVVYRDDNAIVFRRTQ